MYVCIAALAKSAILCQIHDFQDSTYLAPDCRFLPVLQGY